MPASGTRTIPPRALILLAAVTGACAPRPEAREPNPLVAPPVDTARVRSPDEPAAWPHRRALAADLDGDGSEETIVLAADVSLAQDGDPLWEDGHRWAVYVDGPGGRTLLYAAFVPHGHVEAAITQPDFDGRRQVHVEERSPTQSRWLEIAYDGPGRARTASAAHVQVEQRWPDARLNSFRDSS
jgi:hypothetical protein